MLKYFNWLGLLVMATVIAFVVILNCLVVTIRENDVMKMKLYDYERMCELHEQICEKYME